ncbi:TAXI family TRAP transporter solute-binding subunit [Chloroflexota bacterium]
MNRKRKLLIFGMLLALVVLLMPACTPAAPAPEHVTLKLMTGTPGGSWYPLSIALAAVWETNSPGLSFTQIPGGGGPNLQGVALGKADMGITTTIAVGDAQLGQPPFDDQEYTEFKGMARFLADVWNIIVFADSDIYTLEDLKGKRFCALKKGWTGNVMASRQLEAVGLSFDDMAKVEFVSGPEALKLMKDGHLDATIIGFDMVGDPQLVELGVFKPMRILPIPDDIAAKLQAQNPGIFKCVIPKGSYKGVDEDVPGVLGGTGLVVNPTISEDLVYKMTRAMAENWVSHIHPVLPDLKKVQPQDLPSPMGVDLHPGALKYYREVGWIK